MSYTWGGERDASEVTFELADAEGGDVRLELTHQRLATRSAKLSVAGGWHTHLGVLVDHLNGRQPRPFWSRLAALAEEYEARIPADATCETAAR